MFVAAASLKRSFLLVYNTKKHQISDPERTVFKERKQYQMNDPYQNDDEVVKARANITSDNTVAKRRREDDSPDRDDELVIDQGDRVKPQSLIEVSGLENVSDGSDSVFGGDEEEEKVEGQQDP